MTPGACSTHPDRPAELYCDGCGALLCADCIREGHRLLFCRLCGERALPLAAGEPATTTGRKRAVEMARTASYTYREALGYPLRGYGAYAYWSYVGLQGLAILAGALPLIGGILVLSILIFLILVALLLPGFLFAITRSTARGENELPDWPLFDPWTLFKELIVFALVAGVSLLPLAVLVRGFHCEAFDVLTGRADAPGCAMALIFGYLFGVSLWLPAFGAVAIFGSVWLVFRLDLHLRAALADLGELAVVVGLTGGLLALSAGVPFVLVRLPLPRVLASLVVNLLAVYALFVGAHLAGVYFRRHSVQMQDIYGD